MQNAYTAVTTFVAATQHRLRSEEKGATAVEYGLMVALIAVVIIGVVSALGGQLSGLFSEVGGELTKAGTTTGGTATTP
ncbi:Flp family type IVb pilin [Blastococcus sp. LR1]|uniref:Flp family type IVb pilin n=1 Tax=Blastococcus sp. LR1 TaxID=2877000 RepID=UPI001CCE950D|nr:Flp family type IVb pilin [Blastococcus sp. LR1]MCA0143724.1 Flp family type IVb pilin [Blastococcus sp. LR1]